MIPPGIALGVKFQSTLPRRERRRQKARIACQIVFQSTLPRRERLLSIKSLSTPWSVSIHAPTKGATRFPDTSCADLGVSIHAPTKGATAISAKNSFQFSAEINKLSFYILNFPLFPSPLFSTFHFICAYFRVRISRHFYVCFLFALLYYHKIYHLLQFYNRHIFLFYL